MSRNKLGAVKIVLHSNNNDIGEKAEVTVALKNPEMAVERMLHTLAERFPPESVVTISPTNGTPSSSSSGPATSTEGSRSSSYSGGDVSGGPTVALSPALRRGMATLSPELSGWVLSNNPTIFPGLLELVTKGGDPKEFAARLGLSPEPVETVVQQLAQDEDFFEWMSQLANSTTRRVPTGSQIGYPGGLPAPAVGMLLKNANQPKQGYWLIDRDGMVVGHSDAHGNHVLHPQQQQTAGYYPYAPQAPTDVADTSISREFNVVSKTSPEEGSWLLNKEGRLVGHTNSVGRVVMHPVSDLTSRPSQASGFAGLNVVPRDPAHAEDGGPWLINSSGRVVGHYDQRGRPVMHPIATSIADLNRMMSAIPSPIKGLTAVPIDPSKISEGSWLLDRSRKIVGHTDSANRAIMHPQHRLPIKEAKSSGVPELHMIPRDPKHPENGGPWIVDKHGQVIGHYDRQRRPVMHPADAVVPPTTLVDSWPRESPVKVLDEKRNSTRTSSRDEVSPVPGLTTRPINLKRPGEGSWLVNAEGKIVGHTDPGNAPIFHPTRPLLNIHGRPSGLPGISVVPREASRPEDGGPWLVDDNGNVVGHYNPDGRAVLQPDVDFEPDTTHVPIDPSNPRGPAWVMDSSSGLVIGHIEHPSATPVHHVVNLMAQATRPSGVPGISIVDGPVPWLIDNRNQIIGHISPEGRARFHPLLSTRKVNSLRPDPKRPYLKQLSMEPHGGHWLFDQSGMLVGHCQTNNQEPLMHPRERQDLSQASETPLPGLWKCNGQWGYDDDGNLIGHFNSIFVIHPRAPPQVGSSFESFHHSEMLKDIRRPDAGNWLLSHSGTLVGHTDTTSRPIMHPQRPFEKSAMIPIGIPGIWLISRQPDHPELGGPWLVGDDGYVLGHFEPEGRPCLHRNFKSRLDQLVPSPVSQYSAAHIDPVRPSDGVWLMSVDGHVVGHCGRDGHPHMHPTQVTSRIQQSSLKGLSLAQADPVTGGPWVIDASNSVVAHYTDDGQLVLHPPMKRMDLFETAAPQSSVMHSSVDSEGMRVRYIEVPVVEEKVREVFKKEIREIEKRVSKPSYEVIEKIIEVPEIQYVERRVSREVIEEVIRHVPKKEIIEVPKEIIRHVMVPEVRVVEKIVEKPEIIEVPRPYKVEKTQSVPRYVNFEHETVVAQKLRPLITESPKKNVINAKTYEPTLYAVDVYIPKPVRSAITPLAKKTETHSIVEIPAPQYNSLLKAMNNSLVEDALTDLYVRGSGGVVPFLPVGELVEIVPPLSSPIQTNARGASSMRERRRRRHRHRRGHSVELCRHKRR